MNGQVHIIGIGGVGSWLAASMCKLIKPEQITLHDGDTVELKNLDRQFFTPQDIGKNKAEVLAKRLGCQFAPVYFAPGNMDFLDADWLICCADNNAARMGCLADADRCECQVITAANEVTSAEAYYADVTGEYVPDPREYYPELSKDDGADPRAAKIGCVGEAQVKSPQLVSANFMAASLAQWLFVLWALEVPTTEVSSMNLPYRLVANVSRLETHLIRDYQPKENT